MAEIEKITITQSNVLVTLTPEAGAGAGVELDISAAFGERDTARMFSLVRLRLGEFLEKQNGAQVKPHGV